MILLLVLIYIAFISLGLPDAILGSAWPIMQIDINASLESAGIVSFIISLGTIFSSFFSGFIVRHLKSWKVIVISVFLTSIALLGFSLANHLYQLCLLAIPLGLGAGSIDACLNNFVSNHYKSIHMNWLHAFWGVGASFGPLILSLFIMNGGTWRDAYRTVFIIQLILTIILLFSYPLFKKSNKEDSKNSDEIIPMPVSKVFKLKGLVFALLAFLFYCGYEAGTGLWTSSFLVNEKGTNIETAAFITSLFYVGITVGRILSGVLSIKVHFQTLIRTGCIIGIVGVILLFLPEYFAFPGIILIGFGASSFYPQMIHQTPNRFTKQGSSTAMGMQMAFAYIGTTFIAPLIGFIAKATSLSIFPYAILLLQILVFIFAELTYKATKNKNEIIIEQKE
jgi:fucose permease